MDARIDDSDSEVSAREDLQKYCAGMSEDLQLLTSSVALLGHLCTAAASAHQALHSQVLGLDGGSQRSEQQQPGSAATPAPLGTAIRVRQHAQRGAVAPSGVASAQDTEEKPLAEASSLMRMLMLEGLPQWRGLSAAARMAAGHSSPPPTHLLDLPDNVLDIIAKLMGKQARLLCSKLCQLHGSPGAMLSLPCIATSSTPGFVPYASVLQSWQYPVTQLVLPPGITVDNLACRTIVECLPDLRELRCSLFDPRHTPDWPPRPAPRAAPAHTALTRLHAGWTLSVCSDAAAFAPHLRALEVPSSEPDMCHSYADAAPEWRALASLLELQSLDLPLPVKHLAPATSGLCAALRCLTRLTHLGLDLVETGRYYHAYDPAPLPAADALGCAAALEALPLLASLSIVGFARLGPVLGQALQRMGGLRRLELAHPLSNSRWSPASTSGCAPDASTMPGLESLAIAGVRAFSRQELRGVCGRGSTSLQVLRLLDVDGGVLEDVAGALALLPALTRLALGVVGRLGREEHERLFLQEVARLAQLRHLEVHGQGHMEGLHAGLAGLTALTRFSSADLREKTSLRAAFEPAAWVPPALQALGGLGGLRELSLRGVWVEGGNLGPCVGTARGLPLLEELELGRASWEEEDVRLLVPPPEGLRRLVLVWGGQLGTELGLFAGAGAVQRLERYGVVVNVTAYE